MRTVHLVVCVCVCVCVCVRAWAGFGCGLGGILGGVRVRGRAGGARRAVLCVREGICECAGFLVCW